MRSGAGFLILVMMFAAAAGAVGSVDDATGTAQSVAAQVPIASGLTFTETDSPAAYRTDLAAEPSDPWIEPGDPWIEPGDPGVEPDDPTVEPLDANGEFGEALY